MRASRYLTWITLVVIVILVNLPTQVWEYARDCCREVIAPFHAVVSGFGYRVSEGCVAMFDPAGRDTTRKKLEQEIAHLRERVRRMESLEGENSALRVQLGYKTNSVSRLESCEVIVRGETSGWWECITVNKGSKNGIRPGFAVVSHEGLVGRTKSVSDHTSEILLITDRNSSVPAKFVRTGDFGIVNGGGVTIGGNQVIDMGTPLNQFNMDNIPVGAEIQPGDKVVTSGLGSVFPAGLYIGNVVSAGMNKSGLYQAARLKPAANLARLRYVFVVIDQSAGPVASPRPDAIKHGVNGKGS